MIDPQISMEIIKFATIVSMLFCCLILTATVAEIVLPLVLLLLKCYLTLHGILLFMPDFIPFNYFLLFLLLNIDNIILHGVYDLIVQCLKSIK